MKEITNKSAGELTKLLADKREALRTFRFGTAGAKTKNVREGRAIRKDIARILTKMNNNLDKSGDLR
ncbi:MAG: 50S ribosomal protein L29 [Patescibacteria group bacterium]|nr:50S ribosomal protein L29 [Patescibacteria group bacterium]MDE2172589.1 50S ribosomal protein L29 [Patescibacteria group bacterium]